jgi:diguanylate cyclase (GGDEF)-like protein
LPFRFAIVVSGMILTCHALAVVVSGHLSGPVAFVAITTLAASAYLTLTSNYYLERDGRRAYLHALRDRLRHAEVEVAARHDALTGLANRHYLSERLDSVWKRDDRAVSSVAVIMIDFDHFKLFNDHYGHAGGDICLKRIATCVNAELRSGEDLAVRYGGEELLVLLPGTEASEVMRIAERIRCLIEALGIAHEAVGANNVVTVSCGVAAAPPCTVSALELIAAADAALYAAKRNGRNQVWPRLTRDRDVALQERQIN